MNLNDIADFIFEAGMLKRISREGWKIMGITHPESVAEHSLRAAQIGYILAILEGYERPDQICSMLVFHDVGEARIGDMHKIANRYISADERNAVKDQLKLLDEDGEKLFDLWDEMETLHTVAGRIAKDADLLEMAATACEYQKRGYSEAADWLEKTEKRIQTESAKSLFNVLLSTDPDHWWQDLKKV